ncbi:MAG: hypothetical protein LBJ09_00905, partial [Clostridiales bacterium]|nr:hypothetical protein [Clostridiales bacterium]
EKLSNNELKEKRKRLKKIIKISKNALKGGTDNTNAIKSEHGKVNGHIKRLLLGLKKEFERKIRGIKDDEYDLLDDAVNEMFPGSPSDFKRNLKKDIREKISEDINKCYKVIDEEFKACKDFCFKRLRELEAELGQIAEDMESVRVTQDSEALRRLATEHVEVELPEPDVEKLRAFIEQTKAAVKQKREDAIESWKRLKEQKIPFPEQQAPETIHDKTL